jgi:hypothetical protein
MEASATLVIAQTNSANVVQHIARLARLAFNRSRQLVPFAAATGFNRRHLIRKRRLAEVTTTTTTGSRAGRGPSSRTLVPAQPNDQG